MEHRHHARVPVGITTLIYRRGLPIATGRIRDASTHGVFIETECCELARHQRVQCELRTAEDRPGAMQCVWGSVVRTGEDGAALELDAGEVQVADAMIAFVKRNGASVHG
ncbi:MAG: hypothetical protein CALGDGBN_00428 [Pseudomonadales bacterium]|nr:hypothetical protein [Pseudomonadales bacterium]